MTGGRPSTRAGFTLVEVMVTVTLVSFLCASAFAGLNLLSRTAMRTAVRSEAYRLMQDKAEQLMAADYTGFTSSSDQTITSSIKTSSVPGTETQFQYPSAGTRGRVTFTRKVVDVSSTSTSKTLRVEVRWTWQGATTTISTPLFRAM